jgi:hypothetical protein
MPQFPDWKRPVAAWRDAAESGRTQVQHALADLLTLGQSSTVDAAQRARAFAADSRDAGFDLASRLADELRRRMNVLGLATHDDVAAQIEAQRAREDDLRVALVGELQQLVNAAVAAAEDMLDYELDLDEPVVASSTLHEIESQLDELAEYDEEDVDFDLLEDDEYEAL